MVGDKYVVPNLGRGARSNWLLLLNGNDERIDDDKDVFVFSNQLDKVLDFKTKVSEFNNWRRTGMLLPLISTVSIYTSHAVPSSVGVMSAELQIAPSMVIWSLH